MQTAAIIASGGVGKRFSTSSKKQFESLKGKPVLAHSIYPFQKSSLINEIVLVVPSEDIGMTEREIVDHFGFTKVKAVIAGGKERQDSVYAGLQNFKTKPDIVLIHDGVRPFIKIQEIEASISEARENGAVIFATKARNTIKKVSPSQKIISTFMRDEIWEAQTPQTFQYELILEAFKKAMNDKYYSTDDAALVERIGREVKVLEGSPFNIKITYPIDFKIAEAILEEWSY